MWWLVRLHDGCEPNAERSSNRGHRLHLQPSYNVSTQLRCSLDDTAFRLRTRSEPLYRWSRSPWRSATLIASATTPIAVTSAPAPAPWTIRGRCEYRFVWNATMLSEPDRADANGWEAGYLVA